MAFCLCGCVNLAELHWRGESDIYLRPKTQFNGRDALSWSPKIKFVFESHDLGFMNENRLGELTEQEFTGMMDFVLSDEFDQIPASAFIRILRAMDKMDTPSREGGIGQMTYRRR